MSIQGKAFFKETPIITKSSPKPNMKIKENTARILPDHPMSVEDSYLYSLGSSEVGTARLGDMGGLEIGAGGGYQKNLNDIVHIHTAMSFYYKDGTLYIDQGNK